MWPLLWLWLCAALVHAQLHSTSQNNPLRLIAASAPKKQQDPICCLRPLPSNTSAEDDLLSFEDWKAKEQAKEQVVQETNATSLTEDTTPEPSPPTVEQPIAEVSAGQLEWPHKQIPLTDRFNYAGLDCSARVHSAHRTAKSALNILSHKKDKYMLSPCSGSERKFVVVELCEDIRIDTVQLANFEFFSGVFKDFTVSVAKTYTTEEDGWTVAGMYRANNTRAVQSFHPPPSLRDFYRFIRIDFHSHYGNEYYCPISLLRVYGLTHLEQWKWDLWEEENKAKKAESILEDILELPTSTLIEDASLTASSFTHTSSSSDPTPQSSFILQSQPNDKNATHEPTPTIIDVSVQLPTPSPHTDEPTLPSYKPTTRLATTITPVYTQPASVSVFSSGESIYRTIMNRLVALEVNHTLYARYAQEQHFGVREALRRLSEDVGRLEGIGKSQFQSYQRSVLEWKRHRESVDADYQELARKVDHLAKEIVIEKWLSIAQMILLIVVLVFVGITRGTAPTVNIARPKIGVREWGRRHLSLTSLNGWNGRSRSAEPIPSPKQEPDPDVKVEFPKSPLPDLTRPITPTRQRSHHPRILSSPISINARLRKRAGMPTNTLLTSSPPMAQSKSLSAVIGLPKRSRTAHLHPVRWKGRWKQSVDESTTPGSESDVWVDDD